MIKNIESLVFFTLKVVVNKKENDKLTLQLKNNTKTKNYFDFIDFQHTVGKNKQSEKQLSKSILTLLDIFGLK